jgi:ferritin-like metal-binding protein YciE
MPSPNSANEILATELKEIYSAEKQLARALPRLAKKISNERLTECIDVRIEQGSRLIDEIEEALDEMETSRGRPKNVAAEGLIKDTEEHAQEIDDEKFLEPVLTASLQKLEHYCIAAWGTAKSLGELLEIQAVVDSMEHALEEGREMDENLTQLAEEELNPAMMEGEEEEGEEEEDEEGEKTEEDKSRPRRRRASR